MANKNKSGRGRPSDAQETETSAEPAVDLLSLRSPASTPTATDSEMVEPSEDGNASGFSTPTGTPSLVSSIPLLDIFQEQFGLSSEAPLVCSMRNAATEPGCAVTQELVDSIAMLPSRLEGAPGYGWFLKSGEPLRIRGFGLFEAYSDKNKLGEYFDMYQPATTKVRTCCIFLFAY